VLLALSMLFNY